MYWWSSQDGQKAIGGGSAKGGKWFPDLAKHMKALLEDLQIHHEMQLDLNIQSGVRCLDGESIEHLWAIMNGYASSTKEMGPGSQWDTLDCHFNFLNWGKFVLFGIMLVWKLIKAREELVCQTEVHKLFMKCLLIAGLAEKWTAEVMEWEADMSKPSPYVMLEDQQQCMRVLADGDRVLSQAEATDLKRRHVHLQKNLPLFCKLQAVYIPGAAIQIARENVAHEVEVQVEDKKIWLPSDFSAGSWPKACYKGLAEKEEEL
ncbi:hypothetical protein EV421DRAFT_1743866 [Armillaria borealis]|uniref:Uncharacterized protein n=1 Tax=Armillaria borealis TaxID=47425 RepID=A0AA39IVG9_9AGAR|nr:hypothetical protein EV421DRAFT_1743866 [Armillaria borealis]